MKRIQTLIVSSFALLAGALFADEMKKAALDGYCPVCYLAAGKAVKGTSEFKASHDEKTYYFVSQDAVDAFNKEPEKFTPAYDGYCAYGMTFGKKFPTDPTVFTVVDGKIYLNKDKAIGEKFAKDPKGFVAKADAEWEKLQAEMKKAAMKEAEMKKAEMMKK